MEGNCSFRNYNLLSDTAFEFETNNIYIFIIIIIISALLLLFEEGYRFKIITESLKGNNYSPIIRDIPHILEEGFYEVITLGVYFLIYFILYIVFIKSMGINDNFFPKLIFLILSQTSTLLFMGSPIYKALNGGEFKSGSNLIGILKLYYKMGLTQIIIMIIVLLIGQNIIFSVVINVGILETHHFLEFMLYFFLAPGLLLFETRLISICGKESISNQN